MTLSREGDEANPRTSKAGESQSSPRGYFGLLIGTWMPYSVDPPRNINSTRLSGVSSSTRFRLADSATDRIRNFCPFQLLCPFCISNVLCIELYFRPHKFGSIETGLWRRLSSGTPPHVYLPLPWDSSFPWRTRHVHGSTRC